MIISDAPENIDGLAQYLSPPASTASNKNPWAAYAKPSTHEGPPSWEDVFGQFNAAHQAQYGKPINRAWTADQDSAAAKLKIDDVYKQGVADYNAANNTDYPVYEPVLGLDVQPNAYTPSDDEKSWWVKNRGTVLGIAALAVGLPYVMELAATLGAEAATLTLAEAGAIEAGATIGATAGVVAPEAAAFVFNAAADSLAASQALGLTVADVVAGTVAPAVAAGGSTFASIAANPGLALGQAMGVTNPAAAQALGQTVINTAMNGGDVEAALKNAALSAGVNFAGSNISSAVKTALVDSGLPPSVNNAITSGATSLAKATLAGKDPLAALVGTEVGIAVGELANQIPGFSDMSPYQKQAATSAISGTLSGKTGAQLTNDQLNLALKAGVKAGAEALDSPQNIAQDGGGTTAAMQGGFGDTADKPVTEQDLQDVLKGYTPTTDYGVNTGGYEISKAGSTEGLTVPVNTHTFNEDGTIDYGVADTDAGEEIGLQMPTAPSQTDMGGGYGFITPVEGGYMTSLGFVPTDHSQILGDPASFINDPNVLGKTVIGPDTIRAPLDVTPATKPKAPVIPVKPTTAPPAAPSKPTAPTAEMQTSQTQTSEPASLSEIFELYDPFGGSIFQAPRASKTPASSLKSVYTLPPSIRAAEGGSIDDLMEYLRK